MKKATPLFPPVLLFLVGVYLAGTAFAAPPAEVVSAEVTEMVELEGHARVIVKLRTARPLSRESTLIDVAVQRQRAEIARVQRDASSRVKGTGSRMLREFKSLPYIAMDVDAAGLANLTSQDSPVESVYLDRVLYPLLVESTYQVEADIAHEAGITGAGTTIVVIDTGEEKSHPFLSGKVVHEACFATNESRSKGACPNRKTSQIGNGAGEPCTFDSLSCYHGTHVSGIAVGSSSTMTGVAPGATLIPIQVFHQSGFCSSLTPCADASISDVVAALEHVYDIRNDYPIVTVNMSLGGGLYSDVCDAEYALMTDAITNLKSVGIATVAAAGNDGDPSGITAPACISAAISVGAVDELDNVAYFSNGSNQVDLLAPGTTINSSVPGGGYAVVDGTSMATPHVAGAWAIMRQAYGPQNVDTELDFLKTTGQLVTDNRGANIVTLPRLRLGPAAGVVNPAPVLSSVSPNPIKAGQDTSITVTGAGFVRSSVVIADGVTIPTTVLSDTELQAVVPRSMLDPTAESISIVVESPPLGGGTSAPLTITVLQPEISVNSTAADTGEIVTAMLSNSPGNQWDWMVLVPVGAASNAWLKMTFVPSGQTGMTWNVA
ncbi:MAG: S8 family serine peptidase, partial [Pseudomonadales bacterium]